MFGILAVHIVVANQVPNITLIETYSLLEDIRSLIVTVIKANNLLLYQGCVYAEVLAAQKLPAIIRAKDGQDSIDP